MPEKRVSVPSRCSFPVIGVIHTPFAEAAAAPIQPSRANRAKGVVEVFDPYVAGLRDLLGFERIWLIYWLDRAAVPESLVVTPFLDTVPHGVFATRAPSRPSGIGISAVRLLRGQGGFLDVEDVDMLDGTPLVDIKPYVPEFDSHPGSRAGWFDERRRDTRVADSRFER